MTKTEITTEKAIKELKELDNTYTPEKRIELKRKYNIELGMFPE